jgi:molecular chaperone GrpE (heat shock protein)
MAKKAIIIGLLLLGAGVSVFGWVYSEQRKQESFAGQYEEKWEEDMSRVDRMMAGETGVHKGMDIADNEPNYANLRQLQARMEKLEMAMTASIVCMIAGGAVLGISLVYGLGRFSAAAWGRLVALARRITRREAAVQEEEAENEAVVELEVETSKKREEAEPEKKRRFSAIGHALQHNATKRSARWRDAEGSYGDDFFSNKYKDETEDTPVGELTENIRRTTFSEAREEPQEEETHELENSLKIQAEGLEKQIQEIRQMTQSVQQAAADRTEPLNTTLMDLTQQMAAIREYTTHQQERVKKLQEGYDWNIIKTFCLRVIRCIDNLEIRIARRLEEQEGAGDLEEIKDELIFALESSGVEQFELEINSEYRGQEKFAEAVKEKAISEDAGLRGRIAEVLRPGYQYVIAEDNVKVVRTAQVRLFDCEDIR